METDFKQWMNYLGFNGKEVAKAGAHIGLGDQVAGQRNRGEKDLSLTERLAMAAFAAGIPPWSPETKAEIDAYRRVIKPVREVIAENRPPDPFATENRIPAE